MPAWLSRDRIGIVEIKGSISDVQDTLKALKEFREDSRIKAILVRIDSPGGGVGPSQEVYQEIRRTVKSKPVIASLGSVAASGGYYIASAASHIVANPGTVTGSIGVILSFQNLQGLFEKIGYLTVTIKSGLFKDVGNPSREMTPEEKQLLQGAVDDIHGQFVRDVAKGRNLPEEKVQAIADGRILTGESAHKLGLVDELGNFENGIDAAIKLGNIEEEPKLVYAKKKGKLSIADLVFGSDIMEQVRSYLDSSQTGLRYQMTLPVEE
jgi:protease-4